MNIAGIRVKIVIKDSLRAVASCKIDDSVFLTGMRVIEGKNGLFVAMPSKKLSSGEYKDIYFPASKEAREEMQKAILEAYYDEKDKGAEAVGESGENFGAE